MPNRALVYARKKADTREQLPNRALACARKKADTREQMSNRALAYARKKAEERQSRAAQDISRRAFAQLFEPTRCTVRGCDRQPAQGSRFCGCCLEDRRAGRVVIFRGGEVMLPVRQESTKAPHGGATYDWPGVTQ